MKEVLLTFSTL